MITTGGQSGLLRISFSVDRPSMPGRRTSMTMHCGCRPGSLSRASVPEAAVTTS